MVEGGGCTPFFSDTLEFALQRRKILDFTIRSETLRESASYRSRPIRPQHATLQPDIFKTHV
jgi:hypothetical protein